MMTITNEDNMELMARYPDKHFELAIVDPPYGIGESSNDNKSRSKLGKSKNYGNKNWDDKAPNKEYFNELIRISKNQIIWGANHFIENIPSANSSCWIVWDKQNGDNDFADCELAYCSFKTAVRKIEFRWHGMLQGDMKNKEARIHPTQKPVSLYKWILDKYAKQGDKILDTHLGSGSIAIACHDYGFDLTACELDKEYYDAAMKRIKQHTNQQKLF
jgi:site-specific DNA-methyltransferase (adenine-specific)